MDKKWTNWEKPARACISITLPWEIMDTIDATAKNTKISRSDVIESIIRGWAENQKIIKPESTDIEERMLNLEAKLKNIYSDIDCIWDDISNLYDRTTVS